MRIRNILCGLGFLFSVHGFSQSCTLANYQTAYRIPVASFPYFSVGSGITVSVTSNCSTLSNFSYNCGGSPYSGASPTWWLNSASQYIRFTFSAPVSAFTILVNGTNQTEVFYFAAATGAITISNYCVPDFTTAGASVTDNAVATNGSIFTSNNITGSTSYTVTHNGLGSGSRVTLLDCFVPVAPLPVELVSFSGKCIAQNTIKLDWKTASEQNNSFYTIEKSDDAENWIDVKVIPADEQSSGEQTYSYLDKSDDNGLAYYRLKQTDADGNYKHSATIKINLCNEKENVVVYPNPVSDELTVVGLGMQSLQLFSQLGTEVLSKKIRNEQEIKVNLADLQPGIYFLKVDEKNYKIIKE